MRGRVRVVVGRGREEWKIREGRMRRPGKGRGENERKTRQGVKVRREEERCGRRRGGEKGGPE